MRYRAYNKRELVAAMRKKLSGGAVPFVPEKAPAWWDVTKWGKWWETGAKELEKSAPGRLITAPIRIPGAVVSSTIKTVEEIPGIVGSVKKILPIVAVGAVVVGGVFLWSKFGKKKF